MLLVFFGMNRNQGVADFNRPAFVVRRFIFRNSEADDCARYSTNRRTAESGHNRTHTWNRDRSYPKQPAQYARCNSAGDRAGRGAFGRLGMVKIMSEVARPGAIRPQHGYLVT